MTRTSNFQESYLNTLRREKISVALYLVNGIKLQGVIESFDNFSILLKSNTHQLVYKHAVSTIKPLKSFYYGNFDESNSPSSKDLADHAQSDNNSLDES